MLAIWVDFQIVRSAVKKGLFVFEFGLKSRNLGIFCFNGEPNICEADFGFGQFLHELSELQFELSLLKR